MKKVVVCLVALFVVYASAGWSAPVSPLPKGYHSWQKSERKVVTDKSSLFYGAHYLYADKKAIQGYQAGNRFREGSRIVIEFFNIKGTPAVDGPINMIVLMQKDSRHKDTGGWLFAGYSGDGRPSGIDPLKNCFDCHRQEAGQRDFVISTIKDFTR
jgi:Cytochrome P460